MRQLPLLALALCLLLAAAGPAFAEDNHGKRRGGEETVESDDNERAKPQVGAFNAAGSSVTGAYVSFSYNATGLSGYSVGGARLFDASLATFGPRAPTVKSEGATFRLEGAGWSVVAHDVPSAPVKLEADDALATITFAPGVTFTGSGEDGYAFTAGSLSGRVRAEGAQLVGNTLTTHSTVLVFLNVSHDGIDEHRGEVASAIGKGHVGAEATVRSDEKGVRQDVISYGNVTMRTQKLEKGNLTLLVEGHGFEGRVLVLNVDGRVLGAQRASDLNVLLDNATIQPAENLSDVLDPDNDGLMAEYYVVFDPGAQSFQLLVSVPHYSVHTLSVLTSLELPPPTVIVGVLAGVALLVPSAYALFRRK